MTRTKTARRNEYRNAIPAHHVQLGKAIQTLESFFFVGGDAARIPVPVEFGFEYAKAFNSWKVLIDEYRRLRVEKGDLTTRNNQLYQEWLLQLQRKPMLRCRKRLIPIVKLLIK